VSRFDALLEVPPTEVPVRESRPDWRSRRAPGQPKPVFGAVLPVWVTVHVPTYARPGDYKGTLTIRVPDTDLINVPVELKVCGWTLPPPKEYHTFVEFIQSPDTLALHYEVPLWSHQHFQLIERSFRILGQTGTRSVYIPLICESNLGNSESMVRWIKKPGGGYYHDFSIVDRYLHLAKTHLGRLEVVCLVVWDNFLEGGRYGNPEWTPKAITEDRKAHAGLGPEVTMLNPATGQSGRAVLPQHSDHKSRALWKPLLQQLRARLKLLGDEDAMMLGLVTDSTPTKEVVSLFEELLPGVPWLRQTHGYGKDLHGVPYGYRATVWSARFVSDPEVARTCGWKEPELRLQFPRSGMDSFPMTTQRFMAEMNIAGHQRGFGRLGADFWPVLKDKQGRRVGRVSGGRYPKSSWRNLKGVQECEARIFIERALTSPALRTKLGDELATNCQEILDERTRAFLRGLSCLTLASPHAAASSSWWSRPGQLGSAWFISSGWQERSERLFEAAHAVADKLTAK